MKNAVVIGKLNDVTKQISESLRPFCRVQLCEDNLEVASGMLKNFPPDLTVLSLVGSRIPHEELLSRHAESCNGAPIIVIGTKADEEGLAEHGLLTPSVHFLTRPVKLDRIAELSQSLLDVEPEPAAVEAKKDMKKILLVDDDPMMLRIVQPMMQGKYKVSFATSGPKAIATIAKNRPDLILLDYDMPICDGKMTFEMLRSEEKTANIPVIFLTGIADANYVQDVLALHPDGYLLKPPTQEKLIAKIEHAFSKRKGGHKSSK